MRTMTLAICSATMMAAGCMQVGGTTGEEEQAVQATELRPSGKGFLTRDANAPVPSGDAGGKPGGGNGIFYHGGPVMLGTVNVYYIWYGNWTGNSATTILTDFAKSIGGSPYEHINSTYYDGAGNHVSGAINYGGSTTDNYSQGTSLSDAQIQAVVAAHAGKDLPYDLNAVYFVLTSADVTASSGFCTQYCGWHTHGSIGGGDIKYSFVGNPDRCPSSCAAQTTSPNGNAGADGMASIIAHEAEEAISDPDLNAWYDRRGYENADKCAWTFGTTSIASNGSKYNVTLGSRQYLIQQNWVNAAGGYCAMSY
jgi:Phosphate-induced protein 1 conserved region